MQNDLKKKIDKLCKTGCIISIISSVIIIIVALLSGLLVLMLDKNTNLTQDKIDAIMWIIFGLFQPLPLYFTIRLLKEKANSNISAGIISLLFSGLIGGILILTGKYEEIPSENIGKEEKGYS